MVSVYAAFHRINGLHHGRIVFNCTIVFGCDKVTRSTISAVHLCLGTDNSRLILTIASLNLLIVMFRRWQHSTVVWWFNTGEVNRDFSFTVCLFPFNRIDELSVILTSVLALTEPIKHWVLIRCWFMVYVIYGLSSTLFCPNIVMLGQKTMTNHRRESGFQKCGTSLKYCHHCVYGSLSVCLSLAQPLAELRTQQKILSVVSLQSRSFLPPVSGCLWSRKIFNLSGAISVLHPGWCCVYSWFDLFCAQSHL